MSILATRFADINRDAIEEYMFRRAVLVFEGYSHHQGSILPRLFLRGPGIKSDAIFNYWPPVNLLALVVLVPIRFLLTPRRFHSLNVFCTRTPILQMPSCHPLTFMYQGVSAAPILILIAIYERRIFGLTKLTSPIGANIELKGTKGMRRFEARADVEAIVDYFVNDNRGAFPESRITRPRHLSASSMMEHGFSQPPGVDANSNNPEWKTELRHRLENIEKALHVLSRKDETTTDSY